MTDLGTLGGDYSRATALNDLGLVTGTSTDAGDQQDAFVWSAGRPATSLGLTGLAAEAVDVNNRGQVIATATGSTGPGSPYLTRGFLWRAGKLTPLATLGGPDATPAAVSATGTIGGSASLPSGGTHTALWTAGP